MHYYTFKPKDYMSKTAFLEPMEDLAYRRMLDHCYLTEKPLPESIDEIAMLIRMRSHTDSIKVVLHYFFELTKQGYVNDRIARELLAYHGKSIKAKASADARWEKERNKIKDIKGLEVQCEIDANALSSFCESNANQEPLTINDKPVTIIKDIHTSDKPKKSKSVMKALPDDFDISEQVRKWASENNHHNLEIHLDRFVEYAKSNGKKYADWDAAFKRAIREDWGKVNLPTFQNNVFNQQPQQNNRMSEIQQLSEQWELNNESNYTPY